MIPRSAKPVLILPVGELPSRSKPAVTAAVRSADRRRPAVTADTDYYNFWRKELHVAISSVRRSQMRRCRQASPDKNQGHEGRSRFLRCILLLLRCFRQFDSGLHLVTRCQTLKTIMGSTIDHADGGPEYPISSSASWTQSRTTCRCGCPISEKPEANFVGRVTREPRWPENTRPAL